MIKTIEYYLTKKYFSLDTLNYRIKTFQYTLDSKNRPPQISNTFYKKSKLSMSASEMLHFVRYFALVIGDLIPFEDPIWELYLSLREILDIILANFTTASLIDLLETLVSEHHNLYMTLFKGKLKPKFHFMLHYPAIMTSSGPLRTFWSMRFESKHRQAKTSANVVCSRKNILFTLALKHQLILSNRFVTNSTFKQHTFLGSKAELPKIYPTDYPEWPNVSCYNWMIHKGIRYTRGMIIITDSKDMTPEFGVIEHLLQSQNETTGFICYKLEVLSFNSHYHSYEVQDNDNQTFFIDICNLIDPFPCHILRKKSINLVTLNHLI